MDWSDILPILIGLLAVVGLPMALRRRRKGGADKVDELYQHLQGMGIKVSTLGGSPDQEKVKAKRLGVRKSVGVIKIRDKNIDTIDVIGVANQYGVKYFLDFITSSSSLTGKENRKKTIMTKRRRSPLWGEIIDIGWKGDDFLAQKLEFDYRLKDKLLQASPDILNGDIQIFPEPKHRYTRIRTIYFLPTPTLFDAIDTISKHTKQSW